MPRDLRLESDILAYLDTIRMVDTHEHLDTEDEFIAQPCDFGRLFAHYASCDLVSAGCPPADMARVQGDATLAPEEKWRRIAPYWERARNTAYCQCLEWAIRDLYGLSGLSAATVGPLSAAMAANRRPGFYRQVFDRAGIGLALWNRLDRFGPIPRMWTPDYDRTLYVQDLLSAYSGVGDPGWLDGWGRPIVTLDDYLGAIEDLFARHGREASALKIGLAYERPLTFPERTRAEIEPLFIRALNVGDGRAAEPLGQAERWAVQDYLVHFAIQQCAKHDLVVKFHTGLQEGNGNTITHSRAALLANLFFRYPQVRFDIYHLSYPYHEELAALAKNFANVAIDFCWAWIISPAVSRRALADFLETVPANKIHGFGGDFIFIEGTYGHAKMAKEGIARVLAAKVQDGDCTVERACELGRWLLRDNAIAWFGLERKALPGML